MFHLLISSEEPHRLYTFTVRSRFRHTEKSQACFSAQGYIGYYFKYPNPIPNIWQVSCIVGNVEAISDSAANNCYFNLFNLSSQSCHRSNDLNLCLHTAHFVELPGDVDRYKRNQCCYCRLLNCIG